MERVIVGERERERERESERERKQERKRRGILLCIESAASFAFFIPQSFAPAPTRSPKSKTSSLVFLDNSFFPSIFFTVTCELTHRQKQSI